MSVTTKNVDKTIYEDFFKKHRVRIKMRLPHGSIRILALPLGLSNTTVDRALQAGWTPEYHADLCRRGMLLIEAASSDDELVAEYKEALESVLA